jgi:uncharacterized protein
VLTPHTHRGDTSAPPAGASTVCVPPRIACRALLAIVFLALAAASAFALDVPPAPAQPFTDAAHVINDADAQALNGKLLAFEKQTGVRFVIYIFPSLGGEEPADFTVRCAEQWKIWRAKSYDKALLFTVFIAERKYWLATSYVVEPVITDAIARRIESQVVVPHFRQQDYAGGLSAMIDAVAQRLSGGNTPTTTQPLRTTSAPAPQSSRGGGTDLIFLIVIAIVFFAFVLPMLSRGGCAPGCGGCFWPMMFMGGGRTFGGGGWGGGGWGGGGGGGWSGGFGGGGSFGGGGAGGGW